MKVAWGITGSGDFMPEIIRNMKEIVQDNEEVKLYIFLSKAAQQVIEWYGLKKNLEDISDKIFAEVDSNRTKPFYYIPGALQLNKFNFFIICPATANTVAKIVNGIADSLIANSVSQAAKANIPIYILPVDYKKGKQTTTLPSGEKMKLEMREVDLKNTRKLSKMRNIEVFTDPKKIKDIFKTYLEI